MPGDRTKKRCVFFPTVAWEIYNVFEGLVQTVSYASTQLFYISLYKSSFLVEKAYSWEALERGEACALRKLLAETNTLESRRLSERRPRCPLSRSIKLQKASVSRVYTCERSINKAAVPRPASCRFESFSARANAYRVIT